MANDSKQRSAAKKAPAKRPAKTAKTATKKSKRPPTARTAAKTSAATARKATQGVNAQRSTTTVRSQSSKKKPPKSSTPKQRPAEPQLLSGGNPQIPKGDGDASVRAYIQAMPGWKHDVGRQLDALVESTVPNVRKAVRWNSPFYGVAGQGWFLAFHCFNKYVKVTFLNGASLRPMPPGKSKDPNVRYLDIREDDPIDDAVTNWIRQASELPGEPLF